MRVPFLGHLSPLLFETFSEHEPTLNFRYVKCQKYRNFLYIFPKCRKCIQQEKMHFCRHDTSSVFLLRRPALLLHETKKVGAKFKWTRTASEMNHRSSIVEYFQTEEKRKKNGYRIGCYRRKSCYWDNPINPVPIDQEPIDPICIETTLLERPIYSIHTVV